MSGIAPATARRARRPRGTPPYMRANQLQCYLMLAVPLLGFALFSAYPMYWLISKAWFRWDGIRWTYVGWQNFKYLLANPVFKGSIVNTFIFFGKFLVEIPLAFILAMMLNKSFRLRNILRGIIFLPNVTSHAVMAVVFFCILGPYSGYLNQFLLKIGLLAAPVEWLGSKWSALFSCMSISIWTFVGLNMLLILAGLQSIPSEYYEAAEVEGAGAWTRLIRITIPTLAPYLQIILMLGIIGTLQVSDLIIVLTNGGPGTETEVMMSYVYHHFFVSGSMANSTIPDRGVGAAAAVITGLIIGAVTAVYMTISRQANKLND